MYGRIFPILRVAGVILLMIAWVRMVSAAAPGRLQITVKSATSDKPIANAKIVLHDRTAAGTDISVTTDAAGTVVTSSLNNHKYRITVTADLYQFSRREVTVVDDLTTEVSITLQPLKEQVIRIVTTRTVPPRPATESSKVTTGETLRNSAATAGNSQSLSKVLATNPGFVEDSVNQSHPRGEHSQTSIYVNGFPLPPASSGRVGQSISPSAIESLDILTGSYAPEFGGETAAILNLTLRSGARKTFSEFAIGGGEFNTFDGTLTVGGEAGGAYGTPDAKGQSARRLSYLFNLGQRSSNNTLESPQPDQQTAHNSGRSTIAFGNFGYQASSNDQFTLLLNTTPAHSQIANRTGLSDNYRDIGQGFGYAGARNASDGLQSQQSDGQDVYQNDNNTFTVLQYRHEFSAASNLLFSVGYNKSKLDILNNNPGVNLGALPDDNSIEFNPTIRRDYDQSEIQLTYSVAHGSHAVKFGGVYTNQKGLESYNLIPASQRALDALFATDPRLAPAGSAQVDSKGNPIMDALGNQVYQINPMNTGVPTVSVRRTGYYAAAFLQDTWRIARPLSLNYGLRWDTYAQKQRVNDSDNGNTVKKNLLSPRVNAALNLSRKTTFRASYNKLFTQPPQAQGAIVGVPTQPQTADLYEASLEYAITPRQILKIAEYDKEIRNQLDTGLLITGTQFGAYATDNLERDAVKGTEFSYDFSPRGGVGVGGYVAYSNVTAKPSGLKNGRDLITDNYNDHDQLNTVSFGLTYSAKNGFTIGASDTYESGVYSSSLIPGGKRQPRSEVNLHLASGTVSHGNGLGLEVNVENIFDSRERINYQSAFSGTRFQQGRRILLQLTGKF